MGLHHLDIYHWRIRSSTLLSPSKYARNRFWTPRSRSELQIQVAPKCSVKRRLAPRLRSVRVFSVLRFCFRPVVALEYVLSRLRLRKLLLRLKLRIRVLSLKRLVSQLSSPRQSLTLDSSPSSFTIDLSPSITSKAFYPVYSFLSRL